jgi:hypothetical protein
MHRELHGQLVPVHFEYHWYIRHPAITPKAGFSTHVVPVVGESLEDDEVVISIPKNVTVQNGSKLKT